jgi:nucleoside-diphosphate-sugar epimerase
MSVLIIGGAGFIGTALTKYYLNYYNEDVAILDNFIWGKNIRIPDYIEIIEGDIRDVQLVNKIVPRFETVVHLAGIVGAPACDLNQVLSYDINVNGTKNIIDACTQNQRVIFISSTSAYGKQDGTVTESTSLCPLTSYGQHKAIGEDIVRDNGCKYIILRPATAFGIGNSERIRVDLLPNTLSYIALTTGVIDLFEPSVIRPFIYVDDFARILQCCIQDLLPWNEVYNLGDPNITMTKEQLARKIAKEADAEIIIREGTDPDQRNYDVDFTKLLNATKDWKNCGFTFSEHVISRGVFDIKCRLDDLKYNFKTYATTYATQKFINEEKNGLYGTNYVPSL